MYRRMRFLAVFVAAPLCAEVVHLHYAEERAEMLDLQKNFGMPWVLIALPPGSVETAFFPSDRGITGYALVKNAQPGLFQLVNRRWQQLAVPTNELLDTFFALHNRDIWVAHSTTQLRHSRLLHYDGRHWSSVPSPNSDRIRTLWFTSADNGWAGGDWGQIMHWNGKKWQLLAGPVPFHYARLFMPDATHGWIAIKSPYQGARLAAFHDGRITVATDSSESAALDAVFYFSQFHGPDVFAPDTRIRQNQCLQQASHDTLSFVNLLPEMTFGFAHKSKVVQNGFLLGGDNEPVTGIYLDPAPSRSPASSCVNWRILSHDTLTRVLTIACPVDSLPYARPLFYTHRVPWSFQEHGYCAADFNHDRLPDLYCVVTQGANRFYLSDSTLGNKQLRIESAERAGVQGATTFTDARANYDEGVSCADTDNDGEQDILVTSLWGPNQFFKNRGNNRYDDATIESGLYADFGRTYSAIWGDVDMDGDVDLFVSNEDSTNHLYLNNGAGQFTDATSSTGLLIDRGGIGSSFADIDDDNDPDLFVPRYGRRNLLYRNDGPDPHTRLPRFTEIGRAAGIAGDDTLARCSSAVFADLDNDADPDLLVTVLTGPCRLYENAGQNRFIDRSASCGLENRMLHQTALILDADHDTDQDIIIGRRNGYDYYENVGHWQFRRRTNCGLPEEGFVTGMVALDWDHDGDLDVRIGDDNHETGESENQINNAAFLQINLSASVSNRDAIAAKAFLYPSGRLGDATALTGMREVNAGSGYNGMNSRVLHFGLGAHRFVDLRVVFPSGLIVERKHIPAGTFLNLDEQTGRDRLLALVKKWAARVAGKPGNQKHAVLFALFFGLLTAVCLFIRAKKLWSGPVCWLIFVLPAVSFLAPFAMLYVAPLPLRHMVSLVFGLGSLSIVLFFGNRLYGMGIAKLEKQEKLYLATSAFFHGEWAAKKLNRLSLFCANLDEAVMSPLVLDSLQQAIHDFNVLLIPELENICELARTSGLVGPLTRRIKDDFKTIMLVLNQINIESVLSKQVSEKSSAGLTLRLAALQAHLAELRDAVQQRFSCSVFEIVRQAVRLLEPLQAKCTLYSEINETVTGRMAPAYLSQIVENLLQNSVRSLQQQPQPRIDVYLAADHDKITIRVQDNGCGIPAAVQARLFTEQISTRKDGGLGLFYSRQILQRYGGSISLVRSAESAGTIMEIVLKRIEHD